MTIPAGKSSGSVEPACDVHGGPADLNQTSLACLTTYAPATMLLCGHVYGQLGRLAQKVRALEEQIDGLGEIVEQQHRRNCEYMALLSACQRDTAAVLNHELDRHALHPAIEAVVALAEELSHLKDCTGQLLDGRGSNDGLGRLGGEIDISCSLALEKLANLGVETIIAAEGEEFNPKVHAVCGCVETVDVNLHGRISKIVTPGIVYRGKVLRPARVLVFRVSTLANQP